MAKTAVDQWDIVAANNTDINSIPIDGAVTTPSQVDNIVREMMAQIKAFSLFGNITLTSTNAAAAEGPILTLYRNSASPDPADIMGKVLFQGKDSAGNIEDYAEIYTRIADATSTAEASNMLLRTKVAGALTTRLTLTTTGTSVTGVLDTAAISGLSTVSGPSTITVTAGSSNYLIANSVIRSAADNVEQLGANTFRWSAVWTTSINSTNTVTISNGTTALLVASTVFRADTNNAVQLGATTFRWSNIFSVDGNFTGTISQSSDERLKKNWKFFSPDFVDELAAVKSGTFKRVDGGGTQVGVGAQSLRKVMPAAVKSGEDGYLSVAYGTAALAACVELAKSVVALKGEVKLLQERLAAVEAR